MEKVIEEGIRRENKVTRSPKEEKRLQRFMRLYKTKTVSSDWSCEVASEYHREPHHLALAYRDSERSRTNVNYHPFLPSIYPPIHVLFCLGLTCVQFVS